MEANLQGYLRTRKQTIELVESLRQDQLDRRPAPGDWSAGEIADHLLRVERFYQGEVETLLESARQGRGTILSRQLADFDVRVRFLPAWVQSWLELPLNLMNPFIPSWLRETLMARPLIPAEAPRRALPVRGRPRGELLNELRQSRDRTVRLFESGADLDWRRLSHRHPVLGWNTLPQLLRLLTLHEARHLRQAVRAVAR
jgi:hypothetical protein